MQREEGWYILGKFFGLFPLPPICRYGYKSDLCMIHLNVVRDGQFEKEGCHGLGKFSGFIDVLRGVLIVDQTLGKLF